MMLLSLGAQVFETVFVHGSMFVMEKTASLGYWLGSSIYNYYYPRLSEIDFVKIELATVKRELQELKREKKEIENPADV